MSFDDYEDSKGKILGQSHDLVLRRIHYYAVRSMDELAGAETRRLPENAQVKLIATQHGRLTMQMIAFVYAERAQAEEVKVIVEQPATWLDHLKADIRLWALEHSPRWAPRWLMRRLRELRVEQVDVETSVRFEHFIKYPDFMAPADLEARVRRLGIGIPETRVDGSWKREKRVPGRWKDFKNE